MAKSGKHKISIYLIYILLFALGIRLFYINTNKALWWDEAVYMSKALSIAKNKNFCGWESLRPILFPYLLGFIFKLTGASELIAKLFVTSFFVLSVYFFHEIIKKLYNDKMALYASAVFSSSWITLFYSIRIMTDILSLSLFVSVIYLYVCMKESNLKYFLIGVFSVIGFLFRFTTIIVLGIIFLDLLYKEQKRLFTSKKYYFVFLGLGLMFFFYFLYNYFAYGDLFSSLIGAAGGVRDQFPVLTFILQGGSIFTWPLYILSLSGLALSFLKPKENSLMIFWFIVVLVFFSSLPRKEDRYIIPIIPALCFLSVIPLCIFKKNLGSQFDSSLIILSLILIAVQLFTADTNINSKAESYLQVKTAGLFIKNNLPNINLISASVPQICYYAELENVSGFPGNESDYLKLEKNYDYAMVSLFEPHPEYAFNLNYTAVKAFYIGSQPVAVIYQIK